MRASAGSLQLTSQLEARKSCDSLGTRRKHPLPSKSSSALLPKNRSTTMVMSGKGSFMVVSRPKWFLAGKPLQDFHKTLCPFTSTTQYSAILALHTLLLCFEVVSQSRVCHQSPKKTRGGGGHYNRQRESALQQYQVLVLSTNSSE